MSVTTSVTFRQVAVAHTDINTFISTKEVMPSKVKEIREAVPEDRLRPASRNEVVLLAALAGKYSDFYKAVHGRRIITATNPWELECDEPIFSKWKDVNPSSGGLVVLVPIDFSIYKQQENARRLFRTEES
jgi:hypothetical protein